MTSCEDNAVWVKLNGAQHHLTALWNELKSKEAVLADALRTPHERQPALQLLLTAADDSLRQRLFPLLVELASVGHGHVGLVRSLIKVMPRDWVLARVEQAALPLLARGDDEEHRRIAELYAELDRGLLARHVARCLAHPNEHVREVGEDFQARSASGPAG